MNEEKIKTIFAMDAEIDSLTGRPFAIAANVYNNNGEVIASFYKRDNEPVKNEWVQNNVLPFITDIEIAGNYIDLLKQFSDFYNENRNKYDMTVLYHMGHVVETHVFREMFNHGFIGMWDFPYNPIEVADCLRMKGYDPDSVDNYAKLYNIKLPEGSVHNPLYDCIVAYKVYIHLIK